MTRFTNGDKILRDRKVHMVIQIGQSQTISFMGMLLVRFLVFLFSLTQKGRESPMSLQARRDRIPLPAVRIASYGDTYHFGGALQQKDDLPKNYVAMSTTFTPKGMPNLIAKLMFKNLNDQMSERILDFTLVLQGEQDDELPERALCTTRMVRVDAAAVAAMPLNKDIYNLPKSAEDQQSSSLHGETFQMWTQRVASEFATAVRSNLKMPALHGNEGAIVAVPPSSTESKNPTKPPTSKNKRDTIKEAIKEVMALLADVKIPLKVGSVHAMTGPKESLSLPEGIVMMPVLDTMNKDEIKRFVVSSNCDVKTISVRIVQTAAWRGRTFPIPIRSCRVELQSGQLFQQGHDLVGNPVFYFTTMCRGPWRRDVAATLSAAIHRFDTNLSEICAGKPDTRCTIVVLLGRPKGATNKTTKSSTEGSSVDSATIEEEEVGGSGTSQGSRIEGSLDAESTNMSSRQRSRILCNPRISTEEPWQLHSSREMLEEFISLLLLHYPDRIHMVLLVKGKGPHNFYKSKIAATRALKRSVDSLDGGVKMTFLQSASSLKTFIAETELPAIVGGPATMRGTAFDFS